MRGAVNPKISYSPIFGEFEACIEAGLDIERWINNEYPTRLKADVIAWHEGHNLIQLHTKDAVSKAEQRAQKQAKKKGRRRR